MKNKQIMAAWDSLTLSPETKERMLQNILAAQSTAASKEKGPFWKSPKALVLAASLCVLCLLCFPFFKDQLFDNGVLGPTKEPLGYVYSMEACQEIAPEEAGGAEDTGTPDTFREAQADGEGYGLSAEELQDILLQKSTGIAAYYSEAVEPRENTDTWKALTSGVISRPCTGEAQVPFSDAAVVIRGTVVSLKSFEVRREDGSPFPICGTVMTVLVSRVFQGDVCVKDTIAIVLPEATYQQLQGSIEFIAPNRILSALQEGQEGIFFLSPAAEKKIEDETGTLYWQDFGEYLLQEENSLLLQGDTGLLYSEQEFPKFTNETSLEEAEAFLKQQP